MKMQHSVMILAAGLGKRMKSPLPKVLHPLAGRPMIQHLLHHVFAVSPDAPVAIVVGHGREQVQADIASQVAFRGRSITFIVQSEQKGTGHAARCAMESPWGKTQVAGKKTVLVFPGDLPLVPEELVRAMAEPMAREAALRLLTCKLPDPTGYGRVIRRGKSGPVLKIVEEKDCNAREKLGTEVAASIYAFQAAFLATQLQKLSNKNAQGEYYLTDLVAMAARSKKKVDVLTWTCAEDLRGINDRYELAQARGLLNQRILKAWAQSGVDITDLSGTWIDSSVELAPGAVIGAGVHLKGRTQIAALAEIRMGSVITDSEVGASAVVGPYAHLRPGSVVGAHCKVGNFVELKNTRLGEKTSVSRLSYLGDATVGARVNIGCGFVTCNFDGRVIAGKRKHETVIEDDVFMGSDCQTVAPIRVGKGAFVASGSTITEDVEGGALAIARSRQVNKPGYARKLTESSKERE